MKTISGLFAVTIVITLIITLTIPSVTASDDSDLSAKPIIFVFAENQSLPLDFYGYVGSPTINADKGNATFHLQIRMPYSVYSAKGQDTVMWVGGYITSVSFKADWLNNQTVGLYTNTSNSSPSQLEFNVTSIPYGNHHLEVQASCVVFVLDTYTPLTSHPFYDSSTKVLDFTVAPVSGQTPTPSPIVPELSWLVILPLLFSVLAVALLVRHRKIPTGF